MYDIKIILLITWVLLTKQVKIIVNKTVKMATKKKIKDASKAPLVREYSFI